MPKKNNIIIWAQKKKLKDCYYRGKNSKKIKKKIKVSNTFNLTLNLIII